MTDAIELGIFSSRLSAVCEEMGAALKRAAFSPNIKDRLDFSCAVFDRQGQLCAQAAHIPVHLGSMAFAMVDLVGMRSWQPGDVMVLNDPYMGGTHLPDVTAVAPVHLGDELVAFVANRAHHANIGSAQPGSMPVARRLEEEGNVISPVLLIEGGQWRQEVLQRLCGDREDPRLRGDFLAQVNACRLGVRRAQSLVERTGGEAFGAHLSALNTYAEKLALNEWSDIANGDYVFSDVMDDDGQGREEIPIQLRLKIRDGRVLADFTGTADQVAGNINCPLSVAAAAVYYVFRCLLPAYAPACAGTFRPIRIEAPTGCLLNARPPAAVAAGNVETSSRIVDVVFGALAQALPERIPAGSQGTMNNLAMGSAETLQQAGWDYYETLAGGGGAGPLGEGLSARQTHMTNTLNTPVESIESHYPLRITRYQVRRGSGGAGLFRGGDGVVREFEFLAPAQISLLTERRRISPWGLHGAQDGRPGVNRLNDQPLPGKGNFSVNTGDRLEIQTPGGGGWNKPRASR